MSNGHGLTLEDMASLRPDLSPDDWQILAHENTACLDPNFNESFFVTVPGGGAYTEVVRYVLPAGMLGILRAMAMQTGDSADQNNIVWQLRFNGSAVQGYDRIVGLMSTFLFPLPVSIGLYDGYVMQIMASNTTGVAIDNVWAMLRGNFFGKRARRTA